MQTLIESPGELLCDFCNNKPVTTEFPATSFQAVESYNESYGSLGSWMACKTCALLVEERELERLVDRATKSFVSRHGGTDSVMEVAMLDIMLMGLYQSFFDAQIGPGKPV